MFKKQAPIYSAALIIYLGIITLWRWSFQWQLFFFWLGGFVGLILYNLDQVAYLLWQAPEELTSVKFKNLIVNHRLKEGLVLLSQTYQERKKLVGHSVIFQVTLVILAFFALSSTASLFGKGLVMGLYLYSLVNQGLLLTQGGNLASWFWQLQLKLSKKGEAIYYLILIVVFFLLSLMLV